MSPILKTKRLILRMPERHDAANIMVLANNPRVAAMLARMPHPYGLADAEAFIRNCSRDADRQDTAGFGIYLAGAARPEFIGACGFSPMGNDPVPHLGYWLGERFWGHGFASEAARAMMAYAFADRGLARLHSGCQPGNHGSRGVLEKLGFRCLGSATIYAAARKRIEPVDSFVMDAADWRRMNS